MLEDFERDRPGQATLSTGAPLPGPDLQQLEDGMAAVVAASAAGGSAAASTVSGMQLVMKTYEAELRNPLRSLLLGDLARAMLIQVRRERVWPSVQVIPLHARRHVSSVLQATLDLSFLSGPAHEA